MQVESVAISLADSSEGRDSGLLCHAVITLSDEQHIITIHECKLVRVRDGTLVLVMPQRAKTYSCHNCSKKNPESNSYCGGCGERIRRSQQQSYYDYVQPRSQATRDLLTEAVIHKYEAVLAIV
jgi:DNA-binding cell septation regulator SpoVG